MTPKEIARLGGKARQAATGQNEPRQRNGDGPTARALAKEHGVAPATVKRDGRYAAAIDALKDVDPDIAAADDEAQ